ncbi:MAG: Dna2/Cas4 domain-containing protein [Methanobacteriota archaeon]
MSESPAPHDLNIPVSSLIMCCRCPRQYYFAKHDSPQVSDRYIICKQISISDRNNPDEDSLWDEINLIHPEIHPSMREYLTSCLDQNHRTPIPSWTETDLSVRTQKYGLHGLIDKFHAGDNHISVVRCTRAPVAGCWPDDRIRIAAYLLCLKESTGIHLSGGYIEYIPDGIIRFCEPQPRDRRALLQGLKIIRLIEKGEFPGKPVRAPCKGCRYTNQCETPKVRTLSDLLFKKRQ